MVHKLYINKEDIENWLNQYDIENYELIEDKNYRYVVNVNKDVNLYKKNLEEIKVKFNIVNGIFDCSYNNLKTLNGCPYIISGNFYCNNNKLITLKGATKYIKKSFDCSYNNLETLNGCPKIIKEYFNFSNNKVNTLEYFPEKVNKVCFLENNPELKELQNIDNFEKLKKIHESIVLNKKLEKEITIDNNIKNAKIKL